MNYKEETDKLLKSLKGAGYERSAIEEKLSLSRNAISQAQSRGGNRKLYSSIKVLSDSILRNANNLGSETQNKAQEDPQLQAGVVPAKDLIEVLKEQNAFLRRNFEVSLNAISEGQQTTRIQLKALTWYSALTANKGDQKAADRDLEGIYSKIAFFEGSENEGNNSDNENKTGSVRKQKKA